MTKYPRRRTQQDHTVQRHTISWAENGALEHKKSMCPWHKRKRISEKMSNWTSSGSRLCVRMSNKVVAPDSVYSCYWPHDWQTLDNSDIVMTKQGDKQGDFLNRRVWSHRSALLRWWKSPLCFLHRTCPHSPKFTRTHLRACPRSLCTPFPALCVLPTRDESSPTSSMPYPPWWTRAWLPANFYCNITT